MKSILYGHTKFKDDSVLLNTPMTTLDRFEFTVINQTMNRLFVIKITGDGQIIHRLRFVSRKISRKM